MDDRDHDPQVENLKKFGRRVLRKLRRLKPLVDVAVPIALVYFALRTDAIQIAQRDISTAQEKIGDRQTEIMSAQNLAAFAFKKITAAKDGPDAGHATIVVSNDGAALTDLHVWAFSYLVVEAAVDIDSRTSTNVPILATHATPRLEAKGVGSIATIPIPFGETMLADIDHGVGRSYQPDDERVKHKRKKQLISLLPVETVVEIHYRDRGGGGHRLYYEVSGANTGLHEVSAAVAMTRWMMASLANGEFGFWAMEHGMPELWSADLMKWPSTMPEDERSRLADSVTEFITAKANCPVYGGMQERDWHHAIALAMKKAAQRPADTPEPENSMAPIDPPDYSTLENGALTMGLSTWTTCDYNPRLDASAGTPAAAASR